MSDATVQWLLGFAGFLIVQTGAIGFFLGRLSTKVENNAKAISDLQSDNDNGTDRGRDIGERLAVLESEMKHLNTGQEGTKRAVEGLSRQMAALVTMRPGVAGPMADAFTAG